MMPSLTEILAETQERRAAGGEYDMYRREDGSVGYDRVQMLDQADMANLDALDEGDPLVALARREVLLALCWPPAPAVPAPPAARPTAVAPRAGAPPARQSSVR